jgi:hypothetical protein
MISLALESVTAHASLITIEHLAPTASEAHPTDLMRVIHHHWFGYQNEVKAGILVK